MSNNNNYTIDEVLNLENGVIIYSKDFFKNSLEEIHIIRSTLQEAIEGIRDPYFVCLYCKQKVRIRGTIQRDFIKGRRKYHFAHLKDSVECPIKTESGLTKEEINRLKYNGEKEGQLHIDLKNKIAELLKLNGNLTGKASDVQVEKTIRSVVSKEWKKPDIQFNYKDEKIALELQLSTTWLDVITKRQNFYKQNGVFILWVFNRFNIDDEQRRLTDNDVIYTNNQNAFVFDEEAIIESKKEEDLVFKCYFKNYEVTFDEITEIWENRFVKLSDLTFVKDQMKVFYFNSKRAWKKAKIKFKESNPDIESKTTNNISGKLISQQKLNHGEKLDYDRISELSTSLSKVNRQSGAIEEKLINYKYTKENIIDSTKNVFMWLLDEESLKPVCPNKFYFDIREQYGAIVKDIQTKEQKIENERNDVQRRIDNINSLASINQNSPYLKVINPNRHKELFEQKITEIGYIDSKYNTPLFFYNEKHWLKDYVEFNRVRYKDGIIFVFDFTLRLKELENNLQLLNKDASNLEQSSNEIKRKIQDYTIDLIEKESKELIDELSTLKQKRKRFEDNLEIEEHKEI